jgi:OOP family OmpA-OmpF porin
MSTRRPIGAALLALAAGGCALLGREPAAPAPAPAAVPPVAAPSGPAPGTRLAEIPGSSFVANGDALTPAGRAKVAEAARTLAAHPAARIEVAGHTDATGTDADNQRRSEREARAVAIELVRNGVAAGRLTVRGYGESVPAGGGPRHRVELTAQ